MIVIVIVGVVLLMVLIWAVVTFNRLVSVRQHLKESWSDVDVELKRRYDLIPNLVSTVKGYAAHERETLEKVVELRNHAQANHGRPDRQSGDEQALVSGLGRLMAVAEAYPDLKADANFMALQEELANTEDRIAAGRRFYNGNVREMNQLCTTVPSNIVANLFGFESEGFFEVDSTTREPVSTDF
ncbi:MAG: LemA family protein [Phycisphaerales bacterium]|jgi:LemA protein|nr:LemA family protein [Phycisphaerales bacterium]